MGVMYCNRTGCVEIMCQTYTSEGYICASCKGEFETLMERKNPIKVRKHFKKFMDSKRDYYDFGEQEFEVDWSHM